MNGGGRGGRRGVKFKPDEVNRSKSRCFAYPSRTRDGKKEKEEEKKSK